LPPWFAVTEQVPVATRVIVEPVGPLDPHTEAGPALKVTARPELAVALTVIGDWPIRLFAIWVNELVWLACVTSNGRAAAGAAL
jgi:hypothetical protein